MLEVVHYIHVVAGATYVGGAIFYDWVVGTALTRQEPADRLKTAATYRQTANALMVWAITIAVLAGFTRVYLSGMITEFADLFRGYGLRATLAVVVIILGEILMNGPRKRMRQGIDEQDDAMFRSAWHVHRTIMMITVLTILFLMVSMRMGIY